MQIIINDLKDQDHHDLGQLLHNFTKSNVLIEFNPIFVKNIGATGDHFSGGYILIGHATLETSLQKLDITAGLKNIESTKNPVGLIGGICNNHVIIHYDGFEETIVKNLFMCLKKMNPIEAFNPCIEVDEIGKSKSFDTWDYMEYFSEPKGVSRTVVSYIFRMLFTSETHRSIPERHEHRLEDCWPKGEKPTIIKLVCPVTISDIAGGTTTYQKGLVAFKSDVLLPHTPPGLNDIRKFVTLGETFIKCLITESDEAGHPTLLTGSLTPVWQPIILRADMSEDKTEVLLFQPDKTVYVGFMPVSTWLQLN